MATDVAALIAMSQNIPDLLPMIRERQKAILSVPPEETSVNTIVSPFSSVEIIKKARGILALDKQIRDVFVSQDFSNAITANNYEEIERLSKPTLELLSRFDEEIASLNLLLEKYVIGSDLT